jgi:hypothetical protein
MTEPHEHNSERCEFCGIELSEQTEPIFIPGPPPATEPPPAPDWSGWTNLGYTEEGLAFNPDTSKIEALTPPDLSSAKAIMEGGTLHVEGHLNTPPEE